MNFKNNYKFDGTVLKQLKAKIPVKLRQFNLILENCNEVIDHGVCCSLEGLAARCTNL